MKSANQIWLENERKRRAEHRARMDAHADEREKRRLKELRNMPIVGWKPPGLNLSNELLPASKIRKFFKLV